MNKMNVECDVAIVGAGPVGTVLAGLLAQKGVSVFIADRSEDVYPMPRAAHFDHEIMRVFQQLGIVDDIQDSIVSVGRYVFQNSAGEALLEFDASTPADTGWLSYMMHQPGIERALRNKLAADPNVTFLTGTAFEGYEETAGRVVSRWQGAASMSVTSSYLVGCDGGASMARRAMGVRLDDMGFDEPWLVMDLVVTPENSFPDHNIQYCDPARPTTYVVMGNSRRRFEFMLKPGETPEGIVEDEAVAELLAPWNRDEILEVERKAVYRFHALVAERWNKGRVFLAGDAAHQTPPFAGQGMCSGIRDAVALAWRIPLALHGLGGEALFASYQAEREPHVRAITGAAIETGRVVCTLDPAIAAMRDEKMRADKAAGLEQPSIESPPFQIRLGLTDTPKAGERFFQPHLGAGEGGLRLDDVLGPQAWLITRGERYARMIDRRLNLRQVSTSQPGLAPFRDKLEGWLEAAGTEAVLVREDRYVFGTGSAAHLARSYARCLEAAPAESLAPESLPVA